MVGGRGRGVDPDRVVRQRSREDPEIPFLRRERLPRHLLAAFFRERQVVAKRHLLDRRITRPYELGDIAVSPHDVVLGLPAYRRRVIQRLFRGHCEWLPFDNAPGDARDAETFGCLDPLSPRFGLLGRLFVATGGGRGGDGRGRRGRGGCLLSGTGRQRDGDDDQKASVKVHDGHSLTVACVETITGR